MVFPKLIAGQRFLQLSRFLQFLQNVQSSDQFALDVDLRIRGPIGKRLQSLTYLLVREDIEMSVSEVGHLRRKNTNELLRESASRVFWNALHEDHNGLLVDESFETVFERRSLLLGRLRKLFLKLAFLDQLLDHVQTAKKGSVYVQLRREMMGEWRKAQWKRQAD